MESGPNKTYLCSLWNNKVKWTPYNTNIWTLKTKLRSYFNIDSNCETLDICSNFPLIFEWSLPNLTDNFHKNNVMANCFSHDGSNTEWSMIWEKQSRNWMWLIGSGGRLILQSIQERSRTCLHGDLQSPCIWKEDKWVLDIWQRAEIRKPFVFFSSQHL